MFASRDLRNSSDRSDVWSWKVKLNNIYELTLSVIEVAEKVYSGQ